jgi:hypothetical protein
MTGNSGVLPPAPGSALAGYWQGSDDSRHAHFIGQDGNLYELLFTAAQGQWAYTNMTGNSGVLPPAPGSALAGYWQGSDDSRHAHFIGQDGNLYELLFPAAST